MIGLTFLGLGAGSIVGMILYTCFGNLSAQKHLARGDFKPEHRLTWMVPGAVLLPIGLLLYGWTTYYKIFWIAPLFGLAIFDCGLILTFMAANTYLVDVFTVHAASATAANAVLRSLLAAILPLFGPAMYQKLGNGWGNSLLAFIATAMIPVPIIFIKYGETIRNKTKVKF